jgi:hypothetical protein
MLQPQEVQLAANSCTIRTNVALTEKLANSLSYRMTLK